MTCSSAAPRGQCALRALAVVVVIATFVTHPAPLTGQSPDWSATLMVPAFPSPFLSEWERNPQSVVLQVLYTGAGEREYQVRGTLRSAGRGEVARAESPVYSMGGGPATVTLTGGDVIDWRTVVAGREDVQAGLRTGTLPEGDYELCARLYSRGGIQLEESCAAFTVMIPGAPELIHPAHGDPVSAIQPTFQWTPVLLPPSLGTAYRVRIVERYGGQTPHTALDRNIPHLEQEIAGMPMLVYPMDALPLEPGKEYVWQVEALDGLGRPILANGLRSEVWLFTAIAGVGLPGGLTSEGGFPDRITLVPGVAELTGLGGAELESTPYGYTLNGQAWLELEAPTQGRARVRLQDLELDVSGGGFRVVGGRLHGLLDVALPAAGPAADLVRLDRLDYSPERGLVVGGSLLLPGGPSVPLSGEAYITAAGLYGVLEATSSGSGPLTRVGGDPVALDILAASLRLPTGELELEGVVRAFGSASPCGPMTALVEEGGVWVAGVSCAPDMSIPLFPGAGRSSVQILTLTGALEAHLGDGRLDPELVARARLTLDGDAPCSALVQLEVSAAGVELGQVSPDCAAGRGAARLGWLDLELSGLAVERFGYGEGRFDFDLRVDLSPALVGLPDLPLPVLEGVRVTADGFALDAVDLRVPDRAVRAAGYALRVSRVRSPASVLAWTDWDAGSPGGLRFTLDLEASMPDLPAGAPACLAAHRFRIEGAELADGRLAAALTPDRLFAPGECRYRLGTELALDVRRLGGAAVLELHPELRLVQAFDIAGVLALPPTFRCDDGSSPLLAMDSAVRLGPDGSLDGTVSGVAPPCPFRFAGVDVALRDGELRFRGDPDERSVLLSGDGSARFAAGGVDVAGSGRLGVDLISGDVTGGLAFDGPFTLDLPADDPVLSFSIRSARLDSAGLHMDGRNQLVLPGGQTIGATFDQVILAGTGGGLKAGRIHFDAPFALDVGLEGAGPSWRAVATDAAMPEGEAVRVVLPPVIAMEPSGLSVDGPGVARLRYDGRDLAELGAVFADDFRLALDPTAVDQGQVELRFDGLMVAHIDAAGFHPNFAYLAAGLVPHRLPIPSEDVAYLVLRDGDELLVTVETVEGGFRVRTPAGRAARLVVPALDQGAGAGAPWLDVGLDLQLDELGTTITGGEVRAYVPPGSAPAFDLSTLGVPFAVEEIAYADVGRGYELGLVGTLVLPGEAGGIGGLRLLLDGAGRLHGDVDLQRDGRLVLLPGSERVAFGYESVRGTFSADLAGGGPPIWSLDLDGALEVALGAGAPYATAATLQASDQGLSFVELTVSGPDEIHFFDLPGLRVGAGHLRVPHIAFRPGEGWDFAMLFDLALAFPTLEGLVLPVIPDVTLGPDGFTIPETNMSGFHAPSFQVADFALTPFGFRTPAMRVNPFAGDVVVDGGFAFDLELSFGSGAPAGLRDVRLSVLDASYREGRFTGAVEPRTLPAPISLALGEHGMAVNLVALGGALDDAAGTQGVAVTARTTWTLPEYMRCDAAGPAVALDADLTVAGDGGLAGVVTDLVPPCPMNLGPLALEMDRAALTFNAGTHGATAELALDGRVRLPAPGSGDPVRAAGSLVVDLLGPAVVDGVLAITEPFRWGVPAADPFLAFTVQAGRLDQTGLTLTGSGSVPLEGDASVGIAFDDLAFGLPALDVVSGSATFQADLALHAGISGSGLTWTAASVVAPAPPGAGLRVVVPAGARLDADGLGLEGASSAALAFGEEAFPSLEVAFSGFRIGFEPVGVNAGRADFSVDGAQVAYVDERGFWPGDIFGVIPLPARLPLGSEDVAYLELRSADGQVLVESAAMGDGIRIATRPGQPVRMVVPALAEGTEPPYVDVDFDVQVNASSHAFVSGSVTASAEAGRSLFSLAPLGFPLEVRRLEYAASSPYQLRVDTRLALPGPLADLAVDLTGLVLTADGLTGAVTVGDEAAVGAPAIASAVVGELAVDVTAARARFGDHPAFGFDARLTTPLVADGDGARLPIPFSADVSVDGVILSLADGDLPSILPLGLAELELAAVGDHPALELVAGPDEVALVLSGVLRAPFLADGFGVSFGGLRLGSDGVRVPRVSIGDGAGDPVQEFSLFGVTFTLGDGTAGDAVVLGYEAGVLSATMTGELDLTVLGLEQRPRFEALRVATDGSVALSAAELIQDPVAIVAGVVSLTSLRFERPADRWRLAAGLDVDLPAPFGGGEARAVRFAIDAAGNVEGGGEVTLVDAGDDVAFSLGLATVRLRYVGLELELGPGAARGGGAVTAVADMDVLHDAQNRIRVGSREGGTTVPGLTIGFDGSREWGNVSLPREFGFDYDMMAVAVRTLALAADAQDPDRFALEFGGSLGLRVAALSGGLDFTGFRITDALALRFNEANVTGGHFTIANAISLDVSGFGYSPEPATLQLRGGGLPTESSPGISEGTESIEVASYLTFGGRMELTEFSGGVDRFLFYRTATGHTGIVVENAAVGIANLLDLRGDFLYSEVDTGFELAFAATGDIMDRWAGSVVGMFDNAGEDIRAGLFVAVDLGATGIPLVPPLMLNELGGGFFFNARPEHLALVQTHARMPADDPTEIRVEAGRFTGLLYAGAIISSPDVAQGRVLLTANENGARLQGQLAMLPAAGTALGKSEPPVRGYADLRVGFKRAYAEGHFQLDVDFDPIASGDGRVEFFVYGADAWGINGRASLEYMRLVNGTADFFVGPPGFMVSGTIWAGFDFWIVSVSGELDGSVWWQRQPTDFGAYLSVKAEAGLAGGAITGEATLRGAFVSGPMIYAGALAKGCVAVLGCSEANIWARFRDGSVSGGFGSDPTMQEIIDRANGVRDQMNGSVADAMAEIQTARPPLAAIAFTDAELAAAYERIQGWDPMKAMTEFSGMRHLERRDRDHYTAWVYEDQHIDWYQALLRQDGAPPFPDLQKAGWADSVATVLQAIAARQAPVHSRLDAIELQILELEAMLAEEWPERPAQADFTAPVTTTYVDSDGFEAKTLVSGPGFDVDADAAIAARADVEGRREQIEQLAEEIRKQIDALESGVGSVRQAMAAAGDDSPLRFAQLHMEALEAAEKQFALQGGLLMRRQDWLRQGVGNLDNRRTTVRGMLGHKSTGLRSSSEPWRVRSLGIERARLLADWSGDMTRYNQLVGLQTEVPDSDPFWKMEADTLGLQLWLDLARVGMVEADSAATAELASVRAEASQRLPVIREHANTLTLHLNRIFRRQADLVGSLYDLYARYDDWLAGVDGFDQEREAVRARLTQLERDIQVPRITNVSVQSRVFGYVAEETFVITTPNGSASAYEHLFVNDPVLPPTIMVIQIGLGGEVIPPPPPPEAVAPGFAGLLSGGGPSWQTRWGLAPGRDPVEEKRLLRVGARGGAGHLGLARAEYATQYTTMSRYQEQVTTPTLAADTTAPRDVAAWLPDFDAAAAPHWIADASHLEVRWSAVDWESGIGEYEYSVGTHADTTAIRGWTSAGGRTGTAIFGLEPPVAQTFHVYVRARNGAGLWSPAVRTSALRYDPTPPVFAAGAALTTTAPSLLGLTADSPTLEPADSDPFGSPSLSGPGISMEDLDALNHAAYAPCPVPTPRPIHQSLAVYHAPQDPAPAAAPEPVSMTWYRPNGGDPESGIAHYLWRVDAGDGGAAANGTGGDGWTQAGTGTRALPVGGEMLDYVGTFHLSVRAVNRAGLAGERLMTSFTPPDPTPPTAPILCVTRGSSPGRIRIAFSRPATDPETGVHGYTYRIRRAQGGTVRGWPNAQDWTAVEPGQAVLTEAADLTDGELYYVDLRVTNGQGLTTVATSGPWKADFSPPPAPSIGEIRLTGDWSETPSTMTLLMGSSTSDAHLEVSFLAPDDPQTGLLTHQWAVYPAPVDKASHLFTRDSGTISTSDGPIGYGTLAGATAGSNSSRIPRIPGFSAIEASLRSLEPGESYELRIRTINGAGLPSPVVKKTFTVPGVEPEEDMDIRREY
jgi:large repetitive protein